MTSLALDTRQCVCGHEFGRGESDDGLSSEEIRLKAEELYESYLAARADQAGQIARGAQAEFARDPGNEHKSRALSAATQEADQARAALAEQSERVAELRRALPAAAPKPVAHVARIVATPARPAVPHKAIPATTRPSRVTPPSPPASRPVKVRPAKMASAKKTPPARTPAPTVAKPRDYSLPKSTAVPTAVFRQAQAAKAEKILRAKQPKKTTDSSVTPATPPPDAPKLSPLSNPVLSKRAPRLLNSGKKDCPNCTASVDTSSMRCRCGYEFPTGECLIPSLAMSEEERAEFAKLFSAT